jgi:hypothetical protein
MENKMGKCSFGGCWADRLHPRIPEAACGSDHLLYGNKHSDRLSDPRPGQHRAKYAIAEKYKLEGDSSRLAGDKRKPHASAIHPISVTEQDVKAFEKGLLFVNNLA